MICHFCNTKLYDTAPAGSLKEVYLFYICNKCQPHEVIYREFYDQETNELIADAIRIDEYFVFRNYKTNITEFDRTIRKNNLPNVIGIFKMNNIWHIPSSNIETVKQKIQLYTTFS